MSKQLIVLTSVALALISTGCATVPESPPGKSVEMAAFGPKSDFIFRGQIRILHTSTIDSPDAEEMGVVRVTDIIQSPQNLAGSRGRDVTVRFSDIGSMSVADDLLLFTTIAFLGDEIGLTELASQPWDETRLTAAALQEDLVQTMKEHEANVLREQVRASDVVVLGTVMRTTPRKAEVGRDTEHDPQWTEAIVQVEEQMQGDPAETVSFLFSASNDVAWFAAPKFNEGDRGVFMLKTHENVTHAKNVLAVIHKTEFRTDRTEIDRVRELARGLRQ